MIPASSLEEAGVRGRAPSTYGMKEAQRKNTFRQSPENSQYLRIKRLKPIPVLPGVWNLVLQDHLPQAGDRILFYIRNRSSTG